MRVSTTFNIRSKPVVILVLFACLACITQKAQADIIAASTFDTDADGWTLLSVGHSWESTGGNPDGYIRYDDNKGGINSILAPEKFLGDWATMGVTNLVYEAKIFYKGSVYKIGTYGMLISGPGGSARWHGPPPDPSAGWLSLDAPAIESEWVIKSGSWDALLADVTELRIYMEYYNNWGPFEITGIDNVQLFGEPASMQVPVDIKPGSCPNPLNVSNKGVLPVAILGSEDFDVTTIDLDSLCLEGVGPVQIAFEDVATPFEGELCDCHICGPDGFLDLTLKFDTQEIVAALGPVIDTEMVAMQLEGLLADGTPIMGEDCVRILKKGQD